MGGAGKESPFFGACPSDSEFAEKNVIRDSFPAPPIALSPLRSFSPQTARLPASRAVSHRPLPRPLLDNLRVPLIECEPYGH